MTVREDSGNGPLTAVEQSAAALPDAPATSGVPATSEVPVTPEIQATPEVPATPEIPEIPATPGTPPGQAGPAVVPAVTSPAEPAAGKETAEPPGGSGPASGPPGRPRARLQTVVLVVSGAICLAALAGLAAVLLHGRPTQPTPPLPSVFRLHPGQCVNSPQNAASATQVVPCAQPHDAEIFAAFRLAGHSWPGAAAVGARARLGCMSRLGGYLNPQLATATLAESYIYPSAGAWDVGERTVICEVRSTQGKLTGSVRGLG
jgi:putative regulator of septum formation